MKKFILQRICLLSVLFMAIISLQLHNPITCHGEDCPFTVDVSPYQVNIGSGGEAHYVRVLTYTWYSNTADVFVYINPPQDGEGSIDPIDPEYVEITRDSFGHLVVKIDLVALQDAGLEPGFHSLKIVAILKNSEGAECEGTGEIYIIDKKGI